MVERRIRKVIIAKNGSGSLDYKVTFPVGWMEGLNITKEDREVYIAFDGEKITIEKKEK